MKEPKPEPTIPKMLELVVPVLNILEPEPPVPVPISGIHSQLLKQDFVIIKFKLLKKLNKLRDTQLSIERSLP